MPGFLYLDIFFFTLFESTVVQQSALV